MEKWLAVSELQAEHVNPNTALTAWSYTVKPSMNQE